MTSTTLNISINCAPKKVYDFVSNAQNLPKWAKTFIRSIKKVNNEWIAETPQGPVAMRIVDKNSFGILDHYVKPPVGGEIYVPMRVIPNGKGSEVLFTVFQQP
ncbi:MAG: polyketide cyclase, partial [Omnitrophica WOR_2 bacterium GWA2_47_8]